MIRFVPGDFTQTGWDAMMARFTGVSLVQSWAWGTAKAQAGLWQVERGILDEGGRVLGAVQVMVRRLPLIGGGLAWVVRAPVCVPGEESRYDVLVAALRRYFVGERHLHLRIAPAALARETDCKAFAAAGLRPAGASGWISAAVDLAASETDLRRGLAQKWRNGLHKAERIGLSIETTQDDQGFERFLAAYRAFLEQRGFSTSVTPDLLDRVQRLLPLHERMRAWRCSGQGEPLGDILIARYAGRAEYLAGVLTEAGRKCNAGQLLLWRALLAEKEAGTRSFDLGGMDPTLTPKGILAFKTGLGGTPYRLADELEADDAGLRARLVRWRVSRARQ